MGLLDDAIREHLELKRRHGADPDEVARQENEALGATRRAEFARPEGEAAPAPEGEGGEAAAAAPEASPEPSAAAPEFVPGEPREAAADEPFSGAPPEFSPGARAPEPAPEMAEPAPAPDIAEPEPGPEIAEPEPVAEIAEPDAPAASRQPPHGDPVAESAPAEPVAEAEAPVEAGDEREPFDIEAEEATPSTDPWLEDERDEVPADETLEHPRGTPEEDVLEETPDFLQETPEHDRLWFEQRPPRDFDWDK